MADNDGLTSETEEKSCAEGCAKGCLLPILVVFLIAGAILLYVFHDDHYTRFGKHRTREMEELFRITVTDDVKLEEYRRYSDIIGESYTLNVSGIANYSDFMESNVDGELLLKVENGVAYDLATGAAEESRYSEKILYEYKIDTYPGKIWVEFREADDGTYTAEFSASD